MLEYNSEKKSLFVQCTDCSSLKSLKIKILQYYYSLMININKKIIVRMKYFLLKNIIYR